MGVYNFSLRNQYIVDKAFAENKKNHQQSHYFLEMMAKFKELILKNCIIGIGEELRVKRLKRNQL